MSAHYSNYTNIDGNTAFLAGAVSTYADAYLCEICSIESYQKNFTLMV